MDTTSEKLLQGHPKDGSNFFKALQRSASKTKFTHELYRLFFVSPDKKKTTDAIKTERSETPFVQYQGKTIRKIQISILKPFGPKLYDTTLMASSWLEKRANIIHHSTRAKNIRRQLILKSGAKVDASTLADNERLIRELPYIEDAYIRVIPVMGYPSMVDLVLQVKDQFSWGINMDLSSLKSADFELYNKNLYGMGHQFNNSIHLDSDQEQKFGYSGEYYIKNLAGTYLNTGLSYQNTYEKEVVQLDVTKKFETFNTRNAGGLTLSRTMKSDRINKKDPIISEIPLDYNYANIWLAQAFKLPSPTAFTRRKLTIATGLSARKFFNRPIVSPEKNQFFLNKTLFLTTLSLSQVQYYKSNLIYNFGRTEDVPFGHLLQLMTGYEKNEFYDRTYVGVNFEKAFHINRKRSYLMHCLSLGGYFHNDRFEQGVLMEQSRFVSRLRKLGRYRFRNFIESTYILGIRRLEGEYIDLNNGYGIRGFRSKTTRGNQRLSLKLESVIFTPYMLGGFRFAFFPFADMGIIGSNHKIIFTQKYYYGMGFGIRLRNENLVFKTIQLRLAFYPKAPTDFNTTTFRLSGEARARFNNFNTGKPSTLEYR